MMKARLRGGGRCRRTGPGTRRRRPVADADVFAPVVVRLSTQTLGTVTRGPAVRGFRMHRGLTPFRCLGGAVHAALAPRLSRDKRSVTSAVSSSARRRCARRGRRAVSRSGRRRGGVRGTATTGRVRKSRDQGGRGRTRRARAGRAARPSSRAARRLTAPVTPRRARPLTERTSTPSASPWPLEQPFDEPPLAHRHFTISRRAAGAATTSYGPGRLMDWLNLSPPQVGSRPRGDACIHFGTGFAATALVVSIFVWLVVAVSVVRRRDLGFVGKLFWPSSPRRPARRTVDLLPMGRGEAGPNLTSTRQAEWPGDATARLGAVPTELSLSLTASLLERQYARPGH